MQPAGGIGIDGQSGRHCRGGEGEAERRHRGHGERQGKRGKECRKSIGCPQRGQGMEWGCPTGKPEDMAVESAGGVAGSARSNKLLRSVFKRVRRVGAKRP